MSILFILINLIYINKVGFPAYLNLERSEGLSTGLILLIIDSILAMIFRDQIIKLFI